MNEEITSEENNFRFIGKGTYSNVYSKEIDQKLYAIKVFHNAVDSNYENKIFGKLGRHRNVIKRYKNKALLEYLENLGLKNIIILGICENSLTEYMKNIENHEYGNYDFIIKQIIAGMTYIHSKDVIHGDLTPNNILMKNGKVKISDFGLSYYKKKKNYGQYICSLGYRAPEYKNNVLCKIEKSLDVWSFGCLLIFFIRRYFRGILPKYLSTPTIFESILKKNYLSSTNGIDGLPPSYCNTIILCLNFDKDERPEFEQIKNFEF